VTVHQKLAPEVEAIWEARLSPEEFTRRVDAALAEHEEIEHQVELITWFSRRYPTARERLAYARRKYAAWTKPLAAPFVPR
jgi:hypothetical protein